MRASFFLKLATTALLPLAGTALAQAPTLISLDQAITLALAHNHSLRATRTQVQQNEAQEITANLRPNPTLGAELKMGWTPAGKGSPPFYRDGMDVTGVGTIPIVWPLV